MGNLWHTAARSTIPLHLDGRIAEKRRLTEKTRGVDDVYLVYFDGGRRVQVDEQVFQAIGQTEHIHKQRGSRRLQHNDESFALKWSADFRGMLWAIPLATAILFAVALSVRWRDETASPENPPPA